MSEVESKNSKTNLTSPCKNISLQVSITLFFLLVCIALGGSLVYFERKLLMHEFIEESLNKQILAGKRVLSRVNIRLSKVELLAGNMADVGLVLSKDKAVFKKTMANLLANESCKKIVVGGGYWPEPDSSSPNNEAKGYSWLRNAEGNIVYNSTYQTREYINQDWYVAAKKSSSPEKCSWSKTYVDNNSSQPMVKCSVPVVSDKAFKGVVTIDLSLYKLNEIVNQDIEIAGGYGFIVDINNQFISYPKYVDKLAVRKVYAHTNKYIDNKYIYIDKHFQNYKPINYKDYLTLSGDTYEDETPIKENSIENSLNNQLMIKRITNMDFFADLMAQEIKNFNKNNNINFQINYDPLLKEPVYVSIFPIPATLWKVVLVTPISKAVGKANSIVAEVTRYSLIIICVAFICFYLFLRRSLFKPIRSIIAKLRYGNIHNNQMTLLDEAINNDLGIIAYWYNYRTKELIEAKMKADQANNAKSDFLANMSHELRTPLNSIIGMSQIILEMDIKPDVKEMLDVVNISANNLLELVNDILDISKIESDGIQLEEIAFNINNKIQDIIKSMGSLVKARGLTFDNINNLHDDLIVVGDPTRFTQIITNLLSNAAKFTPKGNITLNVSTKSIDPNNVLVFIDVIDTGIGIPEEKLGLVFNKFIQGDTATTRKYGGSGLGLCITKQLVEMMGGNISVKSKVGEGSIFSVALPFMVTDKIIEMQNMQYFERLTNCGIITADQVRVIVAEDHEFNSMLIHKLLSSWGIKNITLVEDGNKLIEEFKHNECNLILMDCHMPHLSGYDAATMIRKIEKNKKNYNQYCNVIIIAVTANALIGEREKCLAAGMNDYIAKPIDKKKFRTMLSKWIRFDNASNANLSVGQTAKDSPAALNNEAAVLDLTNLESYTEGDLRMKKEFSKIFVQQSEKHIGQLLSFCIDGESKEWKELSHLLKGGSVSIGANKMHKICAASQEMFNTTAKERMKILKEIQESFEEVKLKLKELDLLS